MAERTLKKTKPPHLPVVLLRPSIIAAAIREPLHGWTDTLSAAGALSAAGGSGILNYIFSKPHYVTDIIPVDYVTNSIIVSTAMSADKPGLTVVHSNSSHANPVTWKQYMQHGIDILTKMPLSTQNFKIDIGFTSKKKVLKTLFFFRSQLPAAILDKVAKIPGIGSPQLQRDVN
jgi:hypothetical protein